MVALVLPNPRSKISFQKWVFFLTKNNIQYTIPYPPIKVDDWKIWAKKFISSNTVLLKRAPFPRSIGKDPDQDWRTWAVAFIQSQL